jgi:nucleotide-binding universal stress UspA family protein
MFKHILVPLDGSPRAEHALPLAAWIARANGARLTQIGIIPIPTNLSHIEPEGICRQVQEAESKIARQALTRNIDTYHLEGIDNHIEIRTGIPEQTIRQFAQEQAVDLIVLCSHGRTGLKRWLLGSVAREIVRHSSIPTLVIREDTLLPAMREPEVFHPLRILVPLDSSPLAEEALQPAAQFCSSISTQHRGTLHLVSVLHTASNTAPETAHMRRKRTQAKAIAWNYLHSIEQRFKTGDLAHYPVNISTSLVIEYAKVADTSKRLIEESECIGDVVGFSGCDMIAMATHTGAGLDHIKKNSITGEVLDHSEIPLLIIHMKQTNDTTKQDHVRKGSQKTLKPV